MVNLPKETKPEVSTLSKHVIPITWVESFKDCAFRPFGVRTAPVSYVIINNDSAPSIADDPITLGQSYGSSGSIILEIIKRMNHDNPVFKNDNGTV